jgi:hypothetical protein
LRRLRRLGHGGRCGNAEREHKGEKSVHRGGKKR